MVLYVQYHFYYSHKLKNKAVMKTTTKEEAEKIVGNLILKAKKEAPDNDDIIYPYQQLAFIIGCLQAEMVYMLGHGNDRTIEIYSNDI